MKKNLFCSKIYESLCQQVFCKKSISFCLPDNVYPNEADFRIIILGDYSEDGAKQFFAKGEDEVCCRWIGEMTTVTFENLTGYSFV